MERALIITPFYSPNKGGAETFAVDLAKTLSEKYLVHISTIKWVKPVVWQRFPFVRSIGMIWKLLFSVLKMKWKYKYDKVLALGLMSSFICFLLGMKYSAIILALYDFKRPSWFRWFLNKADYVFVEGITGKNDMLKAGVKERKIIHFQHWCDQIKFVYKDKNNERLKVLFVGRPLKIKGRHIIEQCEKLTKDIDYEYIDNVKYEDLPKYYQMADVCVVPSLYSEGFSKVVIEAASCGCALITSNKGALPEMVKDFGRVIEPTPENFARELVKLRDNRSALEKIQLSTTLYALENFNEKNANCFLLF